MKKGLSRAELKAAKNLLKKLIEKGEFDSDDKLQAEVVVGMIEEIESWESHWDYNNYAQTTISRLHDGYSSTTYEDLTCLLRGMSILYNLYSEGGMFYVTTTHDLEAFSFNRKSTEYAAITLLKRVSNITMKFKETRPYNEGASYYRATWSKLAQKIDADNALEREIEEYAVSEEAQEVAIQAEIDNAEAEAERTAEASAFEIEVSEESTPAKMTVTVSENNTKVLAQKLMANIATLSSIYTAADDTYEVFDVNTKATVQIEGSEEETATSLDEAYKKATAFFIVEDDGSNDDAEEDFLVTIDTSIDDDNDDDELVDEPEVGKPRTLKELRAQAEMEWERLNGELRSLEKEWDKLRRNQRRCKDKAKIAAYNVKINALNKLGKAKAQEVLAANKAWFALLTSTDEEVEAAKKARADRIAAQKAAGIKYVATTYIFPRGNEDDEPDAYSKECKTLEEVQAFFDSDIEHPYNGGVYDAGYVVWDLEGNLIADQTTGLEKLMTEVNVTEYAVTPEAQEVATQAEIENAAKNAPLYVDEVKFKTFGLSSKLDRKGRVRFYIDGERKSKEDAEKIYNERYEIAVNSTIEKKIRRQLLIVKGCNEETDLAKSQIEKIEAQDGVPTENMKYREYLYWKEDIEECTAKKTAALKQLDELQAKYPQVFSEVYADFQATYFEPAEYAITPEAFEVAVQSEIDNASSIQFNLQAANNVEEPENEKIFVAYVSRFDGLSYHRKGEKFFKNAADAFNYLQKKHYKNDNFELVVESWDSEEDYNKYTDCHSLAEEHIIYKNSPDFGEETASAEIQKLIEERDAKAATDKIAEEKALAEEKARKEKLKQAETTCKALYDDWSKAKKRLADLRRYREQCKDAAKKAAYDLKIAEFEKTFKPLDDEYNAAWDILIHSKANDFEAEI